MRLRSWVSSSVLQTRLFLGGGVGGSPRVYTGEWTAGSVSRTSDCGAQAMFSAYLYQPWTEMFLSQMWVGKMGSFMGLIYGDRL